MAATAYLSDYAARLAADRLTLEFSAASRVPLDGGKLPMSEAPLFGGAAQNTLFTETEREQ